MAALLCLHYPRLVNEELHARGFGALVEAQDVGAGAEVFGADSDFVRAFAETTHVLVHHHAASDVKHLIADIGVVLHLETDSSLATHRIGIHDDGNRSFDNRILGNAGEFLLVVLATEDASAVGGGIPTES